MRSPVQTCLAKQLEVTLTARFPASLALPRGQFVVVTTFTRGDSTQRHRLQSALLGALAGQLFGDVLFILFLFSPLAELRLGIPHSAVALLFICLPVPVGGVVGWLKVDSTIALFRRTPFGKFAWLLPDDKGGGPPQRLSQHAMALATISGVLVFGIYVAFDLAIHHKGLVQAITVGAITGIIFACVIWYTLRRRAD